MLPLAKPGSIQPERRREPRKRVELPVRVWGVDANGLSFDREATARDISLRGALLAEIEWPLRPGDLVGVQYCQKWARYRVIWVGDTGKQDKIRVAVQRLEAEKCPWEDLLRPAASRPAAEKGIALDPPPGA